MYFDPDLKKYLGQIKKGISFGSIYSQNDSMEYKGSWDIDGFPIDGEGDFLSKGKIFRGVWKNSIFKGVIIS